MGGGVSTELPPEFQTLSEEEKANLQLEYDALIAEGKQQTEAIDTLKQKKLTSSTDSAVASATSEQPPPPEAAAATTTEASTQSVKEILLTDLPMAVDQAIADGLTPLVIDRSEDNKVDTFYTYRSAIMLDGKKMGLDKSMRNIAVPEIMEGARAKLVAAIKHGYPLVIALSKSVTDFATTFTDEACGDKLDNEDGKQAYFPVSIFKKAGKEMISQANLDLLFKEEDKEHGVAFCRSEENFYVCLTSQFDPADFEEYLFGNDYGLPKPKNMYQFIVIKPE